MANTEEVINDDELFVVYECTSLTKTNKGSAEVSSDKHKSDRKRSKTNSIEDCLDGNNVVTNTSCSSTSNVNNIDSNSAVRIYYEETRRCEKDNDSFQSAFSSDQLIIVDSLESTESDGDELEITQERDSISTADNEIKQNKYNQHTRESSISSKIGSNLSVIPRSTNCLSDDISTSKKFHHRKVSKLHRNRKENSRLKEEFHQIKTSKDSSSNGPLITVTFKNKRIAKKYQTKVEEFLKELLAGEDLTIDENDHNKKDTESGHLQFFQDFYVDTTQFANSHTPCGETQNIPVYNKGYEEIMEGKPPEENPQKLEKYRPRVTCFNCMGNHLLDKCLEKHDQRRIASNRKQYMASSLTSKTRYHQEEKNQKFKPGTISNELRQALDLLPNQLPQYIYRMRILGYPPGWLKEAEIESSGIMMYGSDGKAVHHDENIEDGEVDVDSLKVQYDPMKLVDYPGFNVPIPYGFIDESEHLGMPPLQFCQLRYVAEQSMKPPEPKPYTKRQIPDTSNVKAKVSKLNRSEEDMEVDYNIQGRIIDSGDDEAGTSKFIPPLPPDTPKHTPPPPPPSLPPSDCSDTDDQGTAASSQVSSRATSPSLTDLEETKRKLMKELDRVADSTDLEDGSSQECRATDLIQETSNTELPTVSDKNVRTDSESSQNEDSKKATEKKHSRSLSVSTGTPVMSRVSSHERLPDSSKFKDGVSEHLPFENMSNSTGMYDKMRHVLAKVKQKLQEI
ncbi:LOW QUALITY PROTEIN: zinc finger CCHC domain-containing protein 8 homolog [Tachypleus tridentatus]|uniref:LOW QUALITY PROTEIN: zinc finger CCHC domain-containing protein 8 homolog n=1 Tax=Tachypleus tridentatus TaxID=6853 RepID=UPI003FD6AE2B